MIQASAIAFRVLLTLVPLALFGVALLGLFGLEDIWRDELAPQARDSLSPPAYKLLDDSITAVFEDKVLFWVTAGALIVVWEGSSVVRALVRVLNTIYDVEEDRSDPKRFALSALISAAVLALLLLAVALPRMAAGLVDGGAADIALTVLGWALAIAALLGAVGLIVRAAPDIERPLRWVSFGAILVVVAWIVMTLLFGFYVTELADYGSTFGHLATVFIGLEYLFLSATVLIGGLVVDSLVEGDDGAGN